MQEKNLFLLLLRHTHFAYEFCQKSVIHASGRQLCSPQRMKDLPRGGGPRLLVLLLLAAAEAESAHIRRRLNTTKTATAAEATAAPKTATTIQPSPPIGRGKEAARDKTISRARGGLQRLVRTLPVISDLVLVLVF